eukprot:471648-Prymnesium_polylepis.1
MSAALCMHATVYARVDTRTRTRTRCPSAAGAALRTGKRRWPKGSAERPAAAISRRRLFSAMPSSMYCPAPLLRQLLSEWTPGARVALKSSGCASA